MRSAHWIILTLILVLGVGLRLHGLADFPLEQDELYTEIESSRLFTSPLVPGIEARPLYFLLQHAAAPLLPDSPVGLRGLPLVFGILGIGVVAWLGWVVAGPPAGLIGAGLTALSPWHIYVSGMGRYWSFVFLLSGVFVAAMAQGLRSPRRAAFLTALLALLLGTLTHPTFLFLAMGAGAGLLVSAGVPAETRRVEVRSVWLPYAAFLAVALGVLMVTGHGEGVRNYAGRSQAEVLRLLPAIVEWTTPTLFVAGLGGAALLAWQTSGTDRRLGAMVLSTVVGSLALLLAASGSTNVYADYGVGALPPVLLGASVLVTRIAKASGGILPGGVLLVVLLAGTLPSTVSHLRDGTRFDYRPAFEFIRRTEPKSTVATWPIIVQRRYAPDLRAVELRLSRPFLDSLAAADSRFLAVISVQRYGLVRGRPGAERWLRERCASAFGHEGRRFDYRQYRVEVLRCGA